MASDVLKLSKRDRQERILAELRVMPHVRVSELAERFGVTTETIRRDVIALSEEGLVQRAFGGASAKPYALQPAIDERDKAHVEERLRIGEAAARMVEPGDVVMIDSGSTVAQFARQLAARHIPLTVLTNSYPVAFELGKGDDIRVFMCPGQYIAHENGIYGTAAVEFLKSYRANIAFLGASGVGAGGIFDANSDAVWIKRAMMAQADKVCLLADHSKFGAPAFEVVAPLEDVDVLVTDQEPDEELADAIHRLGVKLVLAR